MSSNSSQIGQTPKSRADANGRYLEDCAVMDDDALYGHGNNPRDAKKLWALSEALTGQVFQY